jgi:hypothetical protein
VSVPGILIFAVACFMWHGFSPLPMEDSEMNKEQLEQEIARTIRRHFDFSDVTFIATMGAARDIMRRLSEPASRENSHLGRQI